ncbi:MAG TPA: hypothetical protein VE178_00410 [Silvibacterium sp.]|jgi:hypothetical protein|nr:hypothetical protein [Silvibacterium sp.]
MTTTNTTDQYITECRRIHERLREIAKRTEWMVHSRCATMDNPNFSRAFTEQLELLQRLSDLDSQIFR